MTKYDVIIIGAGAAGLSAAASALSRGRRVAILDMGNVPARKISVSGGGRCNFTNNAVAADRYFGNNPDFVRSAIARVKPNDILNWARQNNIKWTEKSPGQYFCVDGANVIVDALMHNARGANIWTSTVVTGVSRNLTGFLIQSDQGDFAAQSVIVATGGISFSALGVSDVGYKIAKQFGHKIIPVRPALCAIATHVFASDLSGISVDTEICIGREKIRDYMLFTHFGVGGPAIYRATVRDFNDIIINMAPDKNIFDILRRAKTSNGRKSVAGILSETLPNKLAKWICSDTGHIAGYKDSELQKIAEKVNHVVIPRNDITLHGMPSAEVVRGGVDTSQISSKTMESMICPGLFFAGEVMDIAGDLGGFNLHWAWASGRVAGENA